MKIAVTGGNGDMGRALIPYLQEQGHAVLSIDRALPAPLRGGTTVPLSQAQASPVPPPPDRLPDYFVADVCDFGEVVAALRGCDAVIHLAAHRSPLNNPDSVVYIENTAGSYNTLSAAATLGIRRVCLASSINAIGGAFSRTPRYDYFPLDEKHPTYAEDPYSLSKWVLEQQADAFARQYEWMTIASLRFHGLVTEPKRSTQWPTPIMTRHLWAYTLLSEAARACLLALTADFTGHEVFYIVAPNTKMAEPSLELARQHYPNTAIRRDLSDQRGFFDCGKAERMLGWRHQE
ncbi:MAG: NAD-dependent epimerase/dehydratase family protein [Anaerolineales bacterium]